VNSFIKFSMVGVVNTLVDVTIFTALHTAGLSLLPSNIISTSVALTLSFILNRRFTFPSGRVSPKRIAVYIAVTLGGLWVLAPLTIKALMNLDQMIGYTDPLIALFGHEEIIRTVVPKLGSVAVTLAWNYIWYSQVVFSSRSFKRK
jgi:putative flippase GtrA